MAIFNVSLPEGIHGHVSINFTKMVTRTPRIPRPEKELQSRLCCWDCRTLAQHAAELNWWFQPLWKIWVRQLGWLFSVYGKKMFQTNNQKPFKRGTSLWYSRSAMCQAGACIDPDRSNRKMNSWQNPGAKFRGSMDWFKGKSTGNHGFYHQI